MFYESNYYYVSIIQLLVLIAMCFLATKLLKNKLKLSKIIYFIIALYLLIFKIIDYIDMKVFPSELSSISYFAMGISILIPSNRYKAITSYICFISGLGFIISAILAPGIHLDNQTEYQIYRYIIFRFINHNIMFLASLLLLNFNPIKKIDLIGISIFLIISYVYIQILSHFNLISGTDSYTMIVNGKIILLVFPNFNMPIWYYFIYYPILLLLISIIFIFEYKYSNKQKIFRKQN